MNSLRLEGLTHPQWIIVPCLILCSLDLDSIRNSHGKSDESQTNLADSRHMGPDRCEHNQTETHMHLPKTLRTGREFVGHLMQISDSWTKVAGMKSSSFLVYAWRFIDCKLLPKEKLL